MVKELIPLERIFEQVIVKQEEKGYLDIHLFYQ